jgi:cellulose synthase/poly-beta-1,6-N-acetylglucosamine synthase-like glycosyltransferase
MNDFPKEALEVLVVDGASEDKTREIIGSYIERNPCIRLLDNPDKIQTIATNIALRSASGNIIIRMDAHVEYPPDYISQCVHWLLQSGKDGVGGIIKTVPGASTVFGRAIALALSHPFGVGNTHFRIGVTTPRLVDTIPFGCYSSSVFKKIGLFNERLNRTDDIEFNLRLRRAGCKLMLVPDIYSWYYARPDLPSLARQQFGNGFWVIYSLKFAKLPFSTRHLVPLAFVLSLTAGPLFSLWFKPLASLSFLVLIVYTILTSFSSYRACAHDEKRLIPPLIVTFFVLHLSYGIGSLMGLAKLMFERFASLIAKASSALRRGCKEQIAG